MIFVFQQQCLIDWWVNTTFSLAFLLVVFEGSSQIIFTVSAGTIKDSN